MLNNVSFLQESDNISAKFASIGKKFLQKMCYFDQKFVQDFLDSICFFLITSELKVCIYYNSKKILNVSEGKQITFGTVNN